MGLSFEDSLNAAKAETNVKANNEVIATPAFTPFIAEEEDYAVMALDETSGLIAAYSGEETWEKPGNANLYTYYNGEYGDEDYSVVDANKNITLSKSQINLTQETNSQYIPFKIPRYYDQFDLSKTEISIYWVNKSLMGSSAKPVDVYCNSEYIKFAWLIDSNVTQLAGKVEFEIQARGTNSKGHSYIWKTKSNDGLNVLQALEVKTFIEPDASWQTDFLSKVDASVQAAQSAATVAQEAADAAKTVADNLQDGIASEVQNAMGDNYYTKSQVDEKIANAEVDIDLSGYALKSEIPVVPENVSSFTNDAGYLTEHQDISGKADVEHTHTLSDITDYEEPDLTIYALKSEVPSVEGLASETYVSEKIGDLGEKSSVVSYVDAAVESVDISDQLGNLKVEDEDGNEINATVEEYVDAKVSSVDVSAQLTEYYKKSESYSQTEIDNKINVLSTNIGTNTSNISTLNTTVAGLQSTVNNIDTSPRLTYDVVYNDKEDENVGENVFVFYEIENEGEENESREIKKKFTIVGGSGGSGSAAQLVIGYVEGYESPIVVTTNDDAIIKYTFSGKDAYDYDVTEGTATWKVAGRVVATETILAGENSFDVTEYLSVGTQKVNLSIEEETGGFATRTWNVQKIDVRLDADAFNDKLAYPIGPVSFDYTPYGAVSKDVNFILDGTEIGKVTTSSSGIPMAYEIPTQEHGSHLLEVYMTADINGKPVESNHVMKDIIWYDKSSGIPVIGTIYQDFKTRQYEPVNIEYTVYDPSTETPDIKIAVDGTVVSTPVLDKATNIYTFKTDIIGKHIITIECGETIKTLNVDVEELDINVTPVTAGLAFDFNPYGKSNNDIDRLWTDGTVSMSVSDNFDWVNGGYQHDENGDQYFCVKAGTSATIDYQLFADDAKVNGKEFKVVFKTTNIKKRDTSFISCMDNNIGLDMKVESANIYSSNNSLYSPYCEEDIIEFEFNINKSNDIPMVLTYEDGVGNRPMIYTSDASFWQSTPQPITIGCDNCDVHIYRMKAYTRSLSDSDILSNFIADARNADEMIARYNRNQIYDENNLLSPEVLAEKCPDLRIVMIDAPWFTNDKDNKVEDTTIRMIYKNGDQILDNWTCNGAKHSGQGTSSNEYGYAGRNIDLIMDGDTSLFTLGDGTTSKTITLTRNSVPTDYLNVKVNIASSENQNNAQMARRYNAYNPFARSAKFNDGNVKDCMEFYNCVIFVKERDTDVSTHREFLDNNYHFYAIGNIGDSKKTDDTRVNDKNDPKECVVEITDYNVPLAEFPTGNGNDICHVEDWKEGNIAYDYLYAPYKYKEGKFKSFGSESYEFRYEMKGITEEQREENINAWRDMYKFVVTSTDDEFYNRLKEYFVIDSALYYYLFTERYTMVDNRAKNSFWHYGKVYITDTEATALGDKSGAFVVDNEQAAINGGYRWDLSFGYDFDTSLGIDNTGKLVLTYGKEDSDYYVDGDPSSAYIYRAAESTFFCRLRDLFKSEMQGMFVNREDANAWSATGLINQWDKAQSEFPEELWRLDIQRKYLRTYKGVSIDNSVAGEANPRFLTEMMNGRKKYQRRMFERNQELYMATKYFGKAATQDQIMMRFNNPESYVVKPDFTLYITPYSDMYIGVKFGNVDPVNFRAKAGVEYSVPYSIAADTADITLIYGASFIQAIGDLSKCYVGDNDFSKAARLQSLTIGSDVVGYSNTYMKKISLGNNKLLEYLDIRNVSGLNDVVDLSQCSNLLELYAQGSGATGVIFANGGKIKKFYIPSVISLTMKNLNYIEDFNVESYDNLQTLIVENTPIIDTYSIVDSASKLQTLRLIGMDWNSVDTSIFDRVLIMRGFNNDGAEIQQSVLAGNAYVETIKQQKYNTYKETWADLDIEYGVMIEQFAITFVNHDGTILEVQYVDKGTYAIDPITREDNPIPIPVKESTVSTEYKYTGWDTDLSSLQIFTAKTVTAVYEGFTRKYTIDYVSMGTKLKSYEGFYGENIEYDGDIPTFTSQESGYKYYLFNRWDKSGFIDGNKTVNAVFDSFQYDGQMSDIIENSVDVKTQGSHTQGSFEGKELKQLNPVQIYALSKLTEPVDKELSSYGMIVETGNDYSFTMGYDVDYDDIESEVIVSNKVYLTENTPAVFDGSTIKFDTGIKLFDEDKDFILAVDYKMATGNSDGATLVQCLQNSGSNGFKFSYEKGVKFAWGGTSISPADVDSREMLVIRHIKGDNNLYVYTSNISSSEIGTYILNKSSATQSDIATLVFGASKMDSGRFANYCKGEINWCKIWYKDLGDDTCKKLVGWTHEDITLEVSGFYRYQLYDDYTKESMMSLLATHLLEGNRQYSPTISTTNTGGWKSATLNTFLNTRFYNAMPSQIRALLKKVSVSSTIGDMSTEISTSGCYVTIPSVYDVNDSYSNLAKEVYDPNGTINFMTNNESRKRAFADGTFASYWTRSPSLSFNRYTYIISKEGSVDSVGYGEHGVLIEISF